MSNAFASLFVARWTTETVVQLLGTLRAHGLTLENPLSGETTRYLGEWGDQICRVDPVMLVTDLGELVEPVFTHLWFSADGDVTVYTDRLLDSGARLSFGFSGLTTAELRTSIGAIRAAAASLADAAIALIIDVHSHTEESDWIEPVSLGRIPALRPCYLSFQGAHIRVWEAISGSIVSATGVIQVIREGHSDLFPPALPSM